MEYVKKHKHAMIGALLYFIMVIVLLLLLGFSTPLPLPEEQGILLDFGGSGSRDISGSAPATTSDQQNASSQSSASTGVITQDYEPTASLPSSNNPSTSDNVNDNTNESNSEQSSSNADRLNDMMSGAFGGGSGSGSSGSGSGNPGMGDGTSGGSGGGPGGVGGSLEGRKLVHKVDPESRPNMVGTVVLRITVSENGDVTNVTLVRTTCSECVELATRAVKQWRYASSPGSGYQTGEVRIIFTQQ